MSSEANVSSPSAGADPGAGLLQPLPSPAPKGADRPQRSRRPRGPRQPAAAIPGPLRSVLSQAAGMTVLGVMSARAIVTRPMLWRKTLAEEMWTIARRCFIPLALSVFFFGFGTIGVQAGLVFEALGSADRSGQTFVTGAVRELATWATAMVVAGVAGTAITADLGARRIREELDAMEVIGVDPLRALVVPRLLAITLITPMLNMVAILACTLAGVFATFVLFDTTVAAFTATFTSNFSPPELIGSCIKTTIFGLIIGVVCCYKGLHAKGGAEGVGRAVNQAVVIAFSALWIFNYMFTSVLLATYPELQGLR